MKNIKTTVCKDDPMTDHTLFGSACNQILSIEDRCSVIHSYFERAILVGSDSSDVFNSSSETDAVPFFITTIPPA